MSLATKQRISQKSEATPTKPVFCAIYTRKSHEDGLEQEFNSLDAQREACEAFIKSQAARGWTRAPGHYDDGGFSGGTMDRPALKRLLKDIESGEVDVIVVYKIDRLSRSLLDFFQMVEHFEARKVSFVSVTEQFNTTDSSGRLMLGILMSFAQYEREIAGERIRDKVAAAKRHGKWCGGPPSFGYDVDRKQKRLTINKAEAKVVQRIFRRFNQIGSTLQVARELNKDGVLTKAWVTKKGKHREGHSWDVASIYRLLKNRLYIGEVNHNERIYAGEHEAIIDKALWERTQKTLAENHRAKGSARRFNTNAPLRGLLRCGHCGCAMSPTYTKSKGRQFHYYLCKAAHKRGAGLCPVSRVTSGEIEKVVVEQLGAVFRTPELVAKTFMSAQRQERAELERLHNKRQESRKALDAIQREAITLMQRDGNDECITALNEKCAQTTAELIQLEQEIELLGGEGVKELDVVEAFTTLEEFWEVLFPVEKQQIIHALIERVTIWPDGLGTETESGRRRGTCRRLDRLCRRSKATRKKRMTKKEVTIRPTEDGGLLIHVPMVMKKRYGRKLIIAPEGLDGADDGAHPPNQERLALMLARAHAWEKLLDEGRFATSAQLAAAVGRDPSYVARILRLTTLAPDITQAILEGTEPDGLSYVKLTKVSAIHNWEKQRQALGFT